MKKTAIISTVFLFLMTYAFSAPRFVETTRNANIRSRPSTSATLVATAEKGDIFQLIEETDKWFQIEMFSGEERFLYKNLARITAYEPSLPGTIEERREVFQAWNKIDNSAKAEADRKYPPDRNLKQNLDYLHLQLDRKKLEIAHKYGLQAPDLRRIVLEGNFKGW